MSLFSGQKTMEAVPMLHSCCASVVKDGPTLIQHYFNYIVCGVRIIYSRAGSRSGTDPPNIGSQLGYR